MAPSQLVDKLCARTPTCPGNADRNELAIRTHYAVHNLMIARSIYTSTFCQQDDVTQLRHQVHADARRRGSSINVTM